MPRIPPDDIIVSIGLLLKSAAFVVAFASIWEVYLSFLLWLFKLPKAKSKFSTTKSLVVCKPCTLFNLDPCKLELDNACNWLSVCTLSLSDTSGESKYACRLAVWYVAVSIIPTVCSIFVLPVLAS